ncbi:hypothetical protein ACT7C1_22970 [Bacillus paranthracis]
MLETSSQDEQNSNNNTNKKDVTQGLSGKRFPHFNREYKFIVIYYHTQQMLLLN